MRNKARRELIHSAKYPPQLSSTRKVVIIATYYENTVNSGINIIFFVLEPSYQIEILFVIRTENSSHIISV